MDELLERFSARASEAQAVVHRLGSWEEVAALALSLAGSPAVSSGEGGAVAVSPSLAAAEPRLREGLGGAFVLPDPERPFASVADAAVGVVRGVAACAETGSVVLAQHEAGDRAVSMLARTAVQVISRGEIHGSLDDLAGRLEGIVMGTSLTTLVTGPSRTADIERSLTIGVQGPDALHVVVLP